LGMQSSSLLHYSGGWAIIGTAIPPPMVWETGGPLVGVGEKGVGLPAVELAGVLLQLALDADRGTSNHKASGQRRDTGDGGVDAR